MVVSTGGGSEVPWGVGRWWRPGVGGRSSRFAFVGPGDFRPFFGGLEWAETRGVGHAATVEAGVAGEEAASAAEGGLKGYAHGCIDKRRERPVKFCGGG